MIRTKMQADLFLLSRRINLNSPKSHLSTSKFAKFMSLESKYFSDRIRRQEHRFESKYLKKFQSQANCLQFGQFVQIFSLLTAYYGYI